MQKSRLAVLAAVLLAVAFGALLARAIPSAKAGGGWSCYVVDRFPDMKAAAEWKGAVQAAEGLNTIAAGTAAGTLLSLNYPTGSTAGAVLMNAQKGTVDVLCVKGD